VEWVSDPQVWIAFATLAALEIVLGIDNIVFISILVGRLPEERRVLGYRLGLGLAMLMRILLLLAISWVMGLTRPLFSVLGHVVSGRDLVLIFGGLFLVAKSTVEIHDDLEGKANKGPSASGAVSFGSVMVQIALLDVVFSLDSVITAVGMVDRVGVMIAAIVTAVLVMMVFAKTVGDFVGRHPTVRMLALSFLLLIGFMLVVEGTGHHVPKGYIYFAMAFSLFVELLNMRAGSRGTKPVRLRERQ
jgi:predicted tellurium resistance membrane protein TerC